MGESGDFVVPRQQGDPFFMSSRPPLQAWVIALIGHLRGSIDVVAVRLPSVVALLATMLVIYAYSRLFLPRLGSLAASLAYGTMGQVMELCRLGETDSLFALWVSASLMVWHAGHMKNWPAWRVWTMAYLLVALGTLTKGIQAPVYFAGGVGLYLLVTGRWRYAVTKAHLAGIAVFLAVWGAWQVPFFAKLGWTGLRHIYFGDVVLYLCDRQISTIVKHLIAYPVEIFFGCLMPWSLLLLLYLRRDFRQALAGAKEPVVFLACSILAAFPTVWFSPTAKTRFFLSLYPAFAPLVGLVIQRCCEAAYDSPWQKFWIRYLSSFAVVMAASGAFVLLASVFFPESPIAQPLAFAFIFALAAGGLAAVAYWSGLGAAPGRRAMGFWALTVFLVLGYTGVVINAMLRASNFTTEPAVTSLKRELPKNATLVSLGPADHLFAYYYRDPIPSIPWPNGANALPEGTRYFCFSRSAQEPRWPDFPFEQIAEINCDRAHASRDRVTIVGRR